MRCGFKGVVADLEYSVKGCLLSSLNLIRLQPIKSSSKRSEDQRDLKCVGYLEKVVIATPVFDFCTFPKSEGRWHLVFLCFRNEPGLPKLSVS